jgi:hypothetical protein
MAWTVEQQRENSRKRWGDTVARFWSKVDKSGECWLWTGCTGGTSPYGVFRWDGKQTCAHRIAFILSGGSFNNGPLVLHTCDNPLCCRPDHLFAGTQKINIQDCCSKGRIAKGAKLNHPPQDGENNHNAKTTPEVVQAVRSMLASGSRQADVAKATGLTRANVWAIAHGKSWKNTG